MRTWLLNFLASTDAVDNGQHARIHCQRPQQNATSCHEEKKYIYIHIIIWKVGSAVVFIAHLVIPGKPATKFAITNPANCEAKTARLGDV